MCVDIEMCVVLKRERIERENGRKEKEEETKTERLGSLEEDTSHL